MATEIETVKNSPKPTLEAEYAELMTYEPAPIPAFVPNDSSEQKAAFLSDESILAPNHTYDKLDQINFDKTSHQIAEIGGRIAEHSEVNPKKRPVYESITDDYLKKTMFLRAAHDYKHAKSEEERLSAKERYMALNIELYGQPEEQTYRALLTEKMKTIRSKNLTGRAAEIRDELERIVEGSVSEQPIEQFKPSEETVKWMNETVISLYGNMLEHVPQQETFTVHEARDVFETIIREEFGEAAADWQVVIEEAKSINVRSLEKKIIFPTNRADMTRKKLRELVVHEIGVHMLRCVIGENTDLKPLQYGLDHYYDSEEGIGTITEQALEGKYRPAGVAPYIIAGAALHDGMNFRQLFEMQWRMSALGGLKTEDITFEEVEKKRSDAYESVMRIMRGTDDLPWFKDLGYYNGADKMWKYLESIRGDDTMFTFVLAGGRIDTSSKVDQRIVYEARTE